MLVDQLGARRGASRFPPPWTVEDIGDGLRILELDVIYVTH